MSKNATKNQKERARIRGLIYVYLNERYSIKVDHDKSFKILLKQLGVLNNPIDEPVVKLKSKPYTTRREYPEVRVWHEGDD